jgi:hypothetical protein
MFFPRVYKKKCRGERGDKSRNTDAERLYAYRTLYHSRKYSGDYSAYVA